MIAVEEFKEDVQVGDCVRVDTPKGSFSGKVTKIRTTTMKLEVAGREQTIAIDTLEGYEVLDGDTAREAAEAPVCRVLPTGGRGAVRQRHAERVGAAESVAPGAIA